MYIHYKIYMYMYVHICIFMYMYIACTYMFMSVRNFVHTCLYNVQRRMYQFANSCAGGQDSRCCSNSDELYVFEDDPDAWICWQYIVLFFLFEYEQQPAICPEGSFLNFSQPHLAFVCSMNIHQLSCSLLA